MLRAWKQNLGANSIFDYDTTEGGNKTVGKEFRHYRFVNLFYDLESMVARQSHFVLPRQLAKMIHNDNRFWVSKSERLEVEERRGGGLRLPR